MKFNNVNICSISHVDAPHRISSMALEDALMPTFKRLGMRTGVLENVAGIEERRFWDKGIAPSEVAAQAGRLAIERAKINPDQIGVIINTSVCRDFLEPSTACLVHNALKLAPTCMNFDLGSACLGFINGMDLVAQMIESGRINYGLVVNGEGSRDVVDATIKRLNQPGTTEEDVREQFATLTLGSGSAAMILCRQDLAPNAPRYLGGQQLAATQHSTLCQGQNDYMRTDTKRLLAAGINLAQQVWTLSQELMGWSSKILDHFILHQISKIHTQSLAQILGLSLEKIHITFDKLGNIGPAAVPITLSKAFESGAINAGDRVALMAIGSGLNCKMAEILWGENIQ